MLTPTLPSKLRERTKETRKRGENQHRWTNQSKRSKQRIGDRVWDNARPNCHFCMVFMPLLWILCFAYILVGDNRMRIKGIFWPVVQCCAIFTSFCLFDERKCSMDNANECWWWWLLLLLLFVITAAIRPCHWRCLCCCCHHGRRWNWSHTTICIPRT